MLILHTSMYLPHACVYMQLKSHSLRMTVRSHQVINLREKMKQICLLQVRATYDIV